MPLALERHRERRERDLELSVVRLDGRDLLHEKPGQSRTRSGPVRRVAREHALELERDRGDERQERQLHQEEDTLSPSLPSPSCGKKGPSTREHQDRDERDHDDERRAAARVQRGLRARVRDVERLARLVGVNRFVLGAVILKHAVDFGDAPDEQHVADDDGDLGGAGEQLERELRTSSPRPKSRARRPARKPAATPRTGRARTRSRARS